MNSTDSGEECLCCVCHNIKDACFNGHTECFDFYLYCVSDINKLYKSEKYTNSREYYDICRDTLLHLACVSGNTYLVHKLLKMEDINPNIPNTLEYNPLELICRGKIAELYKCGSTRNTTEYFNIIKILLLDWRIDLNDTATAFFHFISNLDKDEIFTHSADSRLSFFNLRKKKCTIVTEIIKLFAMKKPVNRDISLLIRKIISSIIFFNDISIYSTLRWEEMWFPLVKNIDAQKNHILFILLEHGYIFEDEVLVYLKYYGIDCIENVSKIIDLYKNSIVENKEPSVD